MSWKKRIGRERRIGKRKKPREEGERELIWKEEPLRHPLSPYDIVVKHVSPKRGSDFTGDGSKAKPYQTSKHAKSTIPSFTWQYYEVMVEGGRG